MWKNIRRFIAESLAYDFFREHNQRVVELRAKERKFDALVNQRVAAVIAQMDPFEPLMREFSGIFSSEFEHPEERLDAKGQLGMKMWAYSQKHDPHFRHLTEWIQNTQANETLKRAPVTPERVLYGRAQISAIVLFVREVGRLSLAYEELLTQKDEEFTNSEITAE